MKNVFTVFIASALLLLAAGPNRAAAQASDAAKDEYLKQLRALKWVVGPQTVTLDGYATLNLRAGYLFLNPDETSKLQALNHNLSSGHEYFLAPDDMRWSALFAFKDDGYVKDEEKIDADAIFKNIQTATEQSNAARRDKGWDEMAVVGWQTEPHYDAQTHRLEWAILGKDLRTQGSIVNFNTRVLGRSGVMSVVLIANPNSLDSAEADFKSALTGFDYQSGHRYAEYKPGDKVAKYGLAALITGGAAAIAVKTGFWKVLVGALVAGWKFVAAAFVGLFGWFTRRFKKQSP